MINLDRAKEQFKNHVATFKDYGNLKVLDFKNPDTLNYRIRFIFEEDYCKLHISGDLGELIASNYGNMTYEKFNDFVNNIGYFEGKIDCHSRRIYVYDEDDAKEDLKEYFIENDIYDDIVSDKYEWETEEEKIDEVIDNILEDFSFETGIGSKGYDALTEYVDDAWEIASDLGKRETKILELYTLAFKLAQEKLKTVSKGTEDRR